MKLAVFDLDHTLLPIDSGDAWSHWLVEKAGLDRDILNERIEGYAESYRQGSFVPLDFIHFQFSLLAAEKRSDLDAWRAEFIDRIIRPAIRPEALALLMERRRAGYELLLATGTHRFVTEPIAELFGIRWLAAATPEERPDGAFTGEIVGSDSYGEGKLLLVREWIEKLELQYGKTTSLEAWSDSINDLPLLEFAAGFEPAGRAVAANADPKLREAARRYGWKQVELFDKKKE